MRVLACGGRAARDERPVWVVLAKIHKETPISVLIEGGQRSFENGKTVGGVDYFASRWACANGIDWLRFEADWQTHGRAAGPIRNQRMLEEGKPDLVIAFPGGAGTADMVRRAQKAGVPIRFPDAALSEAERNVNEEG